MKDLQKYQPPKSASRFLSWFLKDELLEEVEGDLFEHYQILREDYSRTKAYWGFWFHVLHFLRPFVIKKIGQNSNHLIMYNNYFKFAIRNMVKHKANAAFNIFSLAIGMACFIFIFIYVQGELSYDRFHENPEQVHRVVIDIVDSQGTRIEDATTPPALAPALKKDLPEVAHAVRIFPNWGPGFLSEKI